MKKLHCKMSPVIAGALLLTIGMVAQGTPGEHRPMPDVLTDVCTKLTGVQPVRYALAYIDADESGQYEDDVDILVAQVTETSGNNELGPGDTITTWLYPTSFDPCNYPDEGWTCDSTSQFRVHTVVIPPHAQVFDDQLGVLVVISEEGNEAWGHVVYNWEDNLITMERYYEQYQMLLDGVYSVHAVYLTDYFLYGQDMIQIDFLAPSHPQVPIPVTGQGSPSDDPFINVETY